MKSSLHRHLPTLLQVQFSQVYSDMAPSVCDRLTRACRDIPGPESVVPQQHTETDIALPYSAAPCYDRVHVSLTATVLSIHVRTATIRASSVATLAPQAHDLHVEAYLILWSSSFQPARGNNSAAYIA